MGKRKLGHGFLALLVVGVFMAGCGSSNKSDGDINTTVSVTQDEEAVEDNNETVSDATDTTPPTITLNGDVNITLMQGDTYTELGATASDDVDGNLTADITISGEVDTSKVGIYVVTYSVSDSAGNEANVSRGIEVKAATISVVPTPTPTPSPTPTPTQTTKLSDATIVYSQSPILNQEFNITIEENDDTTKTTKTQQKTGSQCTWSVVSQPDGSNLVLTPSADTKSVVCTPTVAGKYVLKVVDLNGEEKLDTFSVYELLPYDESQIEGNDGSKPIEEISGIIKNQYWVTSFTLLKEEINAVIAKYSVFISIGYDKVNGVLVETNGIEKDIQEAIKSLELESGISSVNHRVFTGEKVDKDFKLPNDGSKFDDDGDNWHLEFLNINDVWDITTGSTDVLVGIEDGGFYPKHDDLKGKFEKRFSSTTSEHGTGVSGTIGALTDNEEGMSGINWNSKLVVNTYQTDCKDDVSTNYSNILDYNIKVKLINNSWGCMGNDSETQQNGITETRTFRNAAIAHPNKLHIWAAGNDGANADTQNGALHLTDNGTYSELGNVIVVAALLKDKKLAAYSDYGRTVDIASPTEFKSTKNYFLDSNDTYYDADDEEDYGTNWSGGFNGTSAAAPVVTGVSSLIYSLIPELNASDVKSILIKSSDENVTERYIDNDVNTIDFTTQANGSHPPIPILNAKAALEMTKSIKEGKVAKVIHTILDPFKAEAKITVSSANKALKTESFDYEFYGTTSEITEKIKSDEITGDNFIVPLNFKYQSYHLQSQNGVAFKHEETGIISNGEYSYDFSIPKTILTIQDSTSLVAIPNAMVEIEPMALGFELSFLKKSGSVGDDGNASLYLNPGQYKIIVNAEGYPQSTKIVNIASDVTNDIKVTIGDVGNLGGVIYDMSGNPIIGATVRLSGGEQTNGFFTSTTTDESGTYQLSNISRRDASGNLIESFILSASANGYNEAIKENVVIITGSSVNYNLTLSEKEISETVIYSTSFEANENSWSSSTGLWHVQDLNKTLFNTLVDNNFSSLPPDETADHAYLPQADDGSYAMWYGLSDTGSFILTQTSDDSLKSGGTSTSAHNGTLTSPEIDLSGTTQPILRFKTWWEIEGVNPNENGYDLMDIQISVDGGDFTTVKRLNPQVDPNDDDRNHKGYSSAGFNRKPIWVMEELDLSTYAGHQVRIQFAFNTVDHLYNGFRGWIIDNLSIIEGSTSSTNLSKMSNSYQKSNTDTKTSIFDGLSEQYIKTHKEPKIYDDTIIKSTR